MAVQRRNTRQRKLVLDAVRQSYNHPTADEIYNAEGYMVMQVKLSLIHI